MLPTPVTSQVDDLSGSLIRKVAGPVLHCHYRTFYLNSGSTVRHLSSTASLSILEGSSRKTGQVPKGCRRTGIPVTEKDELRYKGHEETGIKRTQATLGRKESWWCRSCKIRE